MFSSVSMYVPIGYGRVGPFTTEAADAWNVNNANATGLGIGIAALIASRLPGVNQLAVAASGIIGGHAANISNENIHATDFLVWQTVFTYSTDVDSGVELISFSLSVEHNEKI
jgi:hypothetical protein